jgi:hypothetical protein
MFWKGVLALSGAALVAAVLVVGASAAKPTLLRITVDDAGPDPEITAACGFPVNFAATGHVVVRTFDGKDNGLTDLTTLNVRVTFTGNGNTVGIHDVGADKVRIAPDGTMILSIIGQIPFETDFTETGFHGVLKVDLATGEVLHEPRHTTGTVAALCDALAA